MARYSRAGEAFVMPPLSAHTGSRVLHDTGRGEFLGGLLSYDPEFVSARQAGHWFDQLLEGLDWTRPTVRLFGREISSPRLSAWHGDPDAIYTYSGNRNEPAPWTGTLQCVRECVESACNTGFNSVLANLYRNGTDSMGWHSDDEPELDDASVIASVSLGCTRKFRLQHRRHKHRRMEMLLGPGSLLVMRPPMQRHWRHAVPRENGVTGARINLTFRRIR
jgi:alkylated DNA repair dioxygenase AlkB